MKMLKNEEKKYLFFNRFLIDFNNFYFVPLKRRIFKKVHYPFIFALIFDRFFKNRFCFALNLILSGK